MSHQEQDSPDHHHDVAYSYSLDDILQAQAAAEQVHWAFNNLTMPVHGHPPSRGVHYALATAVPRTAVAESASYISTRHRQIRPVPQVPFKGPNNQDVAQGENIEFETVNGEHISLAHALRGDVDELVNKDTPAFAKGSVSSKVSLRIQFEDGRPLYHRQVMALRSTNSAEAISRGKLATTIARETSCYLNAQELSVYGRTFPFKQVFLARLWRVSKGSWQPEFYVVV